MEKILMCGNAQKMARGLYEFLLDEYSESTTHLREVILEKAPNTFVLDHNNHIFIASRHDDGGGISTYNTNKNYEFVSRIHEESTAPIRLIIDDKHHFMFSLHENGHLYSCTINIDGSLHKEDMYDIKASVTDMVMTPNHQLLIALKDNPTLIQLHIDLTRGQLSFETDYELEGDEGFSQLLFHPSHHALYGIKSQEHRIHTFEYQDNHLSELNDTIDTLPFHAKGTCLQILTDQKGENLYALNRGTNTIACYKIIDDGLTLKYQHSVSTEGLAPHSMALNASDQFLMVTNELSHNLTLFMRDKNGALHLRDNSMRIPDSLFLQTTEI